MMIIIAVELLIHLMIQATNLRNSEKHLHGFFIKIKNKHQIKSNFLCVGFRTSLGGLDSD